MRRIIHIDMDCFFAAVEMREQPHLKSVALAVGGDAGRRGVICTCNYLARRFGVRSAMATAHALKLCPQLVVVPPRHSLYAAVSAQIRAIFERFTPLVEMVSLDEAYLDVTDSPFCHGSATWIAQAIRQTICDELQLTASAGVAPNKFLAKVASERHKPDGLCTIPPDQVGLILADLPVRAIPGVGPVMEQQLLALGLRTTGDLRCQPRQVLAERFGRWGEQLHRFASGDDERPVQVVREAKSLGVETTFAKDLMTTSDMKEQTLLLLRQLQRRLQKYASERVVRGWGLKVKFSDRVLMTISAGHQPLSAAVVERLVGQAWSRAGGRGVRLLGLQAALAEESGQLCLWREGVIPHCDVSQTASVTVINAAQR
ncbi:MAG: DNA polymerase IV [Gammaproteobacteria bacterium]|nr:DNA polymerase IV [Gammaproteobacteria bacterium]